MRNKRRALPRYCIQSVDKLNEQVSSTLCELVDPNDRRRAGTTILTTSICVAVGGRMNVESDAVVCLSPAECRLLAQASRMRYSETSRQLLLNEQICREVVNF